MKLFFWITLFLSAACASYFSDHVKKDFMIDNQEHSIRYAYKPQEISQLTAVALHTAKEEIEALFRSENALLSFEAALAHLADTWLPMGFMGYVSLDPVIAQEAFENEQKINAFFVETMTRKDIYHALKKVVPKTPGQKKLLQEMCLSFEDNGLHLEDGPLQALRALKVELAQLETHFSQRLNQDESSIKVEKKDLVGIPEGYLQTLKKEDLHFFIIPTKEPDYEMIMDHCRVESTRKAMMEAFENRGMPENIGFFTKAIAVRGQIAHLLGYDNWVDFRVHKRMAKNLKTIQSFLEALKGELSVANKADLARLQQLKKQTTGVDAFYPWDIRFFSMEYKKTKLAFDPELVRPYFPVDEVLKGIFAIYSHLLGITLTEDPSIPVWEEHVKVYHVKDAGTNRMIGTFYADLYPRPGKYGHAAAFTLRAGRLLPDGHYVHPLSAIVANFSAPMGNQPSLLKHAEVETFFHEFGHIMHQLLTQAEFASLSGTSVDQDFVEAPSQMLENWVFNAEILKKLSHHFETKAPLPDALIAKIIETKNFNQGYFYTRQLLFGLFDIQCYLEKDLDPSALYKKLFLSVVGIAPLDNTHFPAGFGHLMGGYDAGYYGYLWSKVYAEDMFSLFEKQGLLNASLGKKYRECILEPGKMKEASELLDAFLGRAVQLDAFYKKLGITKHGSLF